LVNKEETDLGGGAGDADRFLAGNGYFVRICVLNPKFVDSSRN